MDGMNKPENKKGKGNLLIVFALLCVLLALLVGSVYLLDALGVFNKSKLFARIPGFSSSVKGRFEDVKIEELRRLRESINQQVIQLENRKRALEKREKEVKRKDEELTVLEETVQQRKIAIEEREARYKSREEKWKRVVKLIEGVNPKMAIEIINGLDDDTVIEILKRMEESNVPETLNKMPPERVSRLMQKMSK